MITSLGKLRAGLYAFRAFVCFILLVVIAFVFPLPFGVRGWL